MTPPLTSPRALISPRKSAREISNRLRQIFNSKDPVGSEVNPRRPKATSKSKQRTERSKHRENVLPSPASSTSFHAKEAFVDAVLTGGNSSQNLSSKSSRKHSSSSETTSVTQIRTSQTKSSSQTLERTNSSHSLYVHESTPRGSSTYKPSESSEEEILSRKKPHIPLLNLPSSHKSDDSSSVPHDTDELRRKPNQRLSPAKRGPSKSHSKKSQKSQFISPLTEFGDKIDQDNSRDLKSEQHDSHPISEEFTEPPSSRDSASSLRRSSHALFYKLSENRPTLKISVMEKKLREMGHFSGSMEKHALSDFVSTVYNFKYQDEYGEDSDLRDSKPNSDCIDVHEFEKLVSQNSLRSHRQEIVEAFRIFDITDNDVVDLGLLKQVYSCWGHYSIQNEAKAIMESFVVRKRKKRRQAPTVNYKRMIDQLVPEERVPMFQDILTYGDLSSEETNESVFD